MAHDNKFTLKKSDQMIRDIMDEFFAQHDIDFDLKELTKVQLLGETEEQLPQTELEGGQ